MNAPILFQVMNIFEESYSSKKDSYSQNSVFICCLRRQTHVSRDYDYNKSLVIRAVWKKVKRSIKTCSCLVKRMY